MGEDRIINFLLALFSMQINFVTHNMGKLKEARLILEPAIKVNHINLEYDEIQHDDPSAIARKSAEMVAAMLGKSVVVDDSGLFVSALHGFPGTFSSTIHKQIGLPGLLKLMEGVADREAIYKTVVAYCEPGKKAITFLGEQRGTLAREALGTNGFGHDPIFIPRGEMRTFGEIENCERLKTFRRDAFLKLKGYLAEK
jgi:XTP/dITP diphosphohydrolase